MLQWVHCTPDLNPNLNLNQVQQDIHPDTNEMYLLLVYVYLYGKYIKRNFCLVLRTVKNRH